MNIKPALAFLGLIAIVLSIGCGHRSSPSKANPIQDAYDTEQDWNDPNRLIPLGYQQAQGKRLFYADCVWCHADSTPAGPSNRSNLSPVPKLINDGAALNPLSDQYLQNMITLGGSALGKSAMMPPWGKTPLAIGPRPVSGRSLRPKPSRKIKSRYPMHF